MSGRVTGRGAPGGGPSGGLDGGVPGRGPGGGVLGRGPGDRNDRRERKTKLTVGHGRRLAPNSACKAPPCVGGSPVLLKTTTPAEDSVALAGLFSWIQSYIGCVMKVTYFKDPCRTNSLCEVFHHNVCATEAENSQFKKYFPHLKLRDRNPYEYEKQFACLTHPPYSSKFHKNNPSTSGAASSGTSTKYWSNVAARST